MESLSVLVMTDRLLGVKLYNQAFVDFSRQFFAFWFAFEYINELP